MTSRHSAFAAIVLVVTSAVVAGCGKSPSGTPPNTHAQDEADANKAKAREATAATFEAERLAELWSYSDVAAGKGHQIAASISSVTDVETDSGTPHPVLLVFRDHPAWGKSSYLVLRAGDFQCDPKCAVHVTVDDAAPKTMAGHRPPTRDPIAIFIDDATGLWRLTHGAKRLTISFPVKAGGTRTADFDVTGLDRSKMPRWDPR